MSEPTNRPSRAWYLLPIFFGIIGGIISYVVLRDEDRKMAKNNVILGAVLTVIGFVIAIPIGLAAGL